MLSLFASAAVASFEAVTPLTVYYEAGCPDSQNFIENALAPVMEHISHTVKLDLVPWGKATIKGKTRRQTHEIVAKWPAGEIAKSATEFSCQHGPNECKGNRLHQCAIHKLGAQAAFPFVKCMMGSFWGGETAWKKCAEPPLVWAELRACAGSAQGRGLDRAAAVASSKVPLFPYVPWVQLGNHHMHCQHGCDLLHVVCHAMRVSQKACDGLSKWEAQQKAAPFKTPCLSDNKDVPHGWKGTPAAGAHKGQACECVFGWLRCAAAAGEGEASAVPATRSPVDAGLGPRCKFVRCELADEAPRSAGKPPQKKITWDKAAEAYEAKHHVCVKNHATGVCECFCAQPKR
jgi:interferon, gamma-inducible protein 30